MEHTQRTDIKRIATVRSRKWATGATAMLLSASLLLAACGDSSGDSSEDSAVSESTVVATMEAPDTDVEVTPEVVEESDTETETITDTGTIVETEVTTETIETDVITETTIITDVTVGTPEVTDTETEVMTDTEGMDDSDTMTDTGSVDTTDTTTNTTADTGATMPMMGVSGAAAQQYMRASSLLDYDFENLNDEVSGDLEDLLIDLSTGRVLFASIEYGGVLDLGDKDIVVPLNAFTFGEEGELVLNIDEATLESYPDVGNDWPDLNDPLWDDDVNTYWNDTGIDVGSGYSEATTNVAWASELLGHGVADLGAGPGTIMDMLVNLETGHASYFIVDYNEGLDSDPYIIPVSAYNVTNWTDEAEFGYSPDFTPDILESAPRYDQEMYPDGSSLDSDFGDNIESTWNDLGFRNDLNRDGAVD